MARRRLPGHEVKRTVAERASRFLADWSLPRQLAGGDPKRAAARPTTSATLRPRLEEADHVGTGICPFCAVGCGQLVYSKHGRPIHIEGDPRSPVNQGTLCPKGGSVLGLLLSPDRITTVKYRAPFATEWEDRPLDWAMERIATLTRQTRDETFVHKLPGGEVVNHTVGIGSLGGATLDNEENYLIKKLLGGGLGILNIENQARI